MNNPHPFNPRDLKSIEVTISRHAIDVVDTDTDEAARFCALLASDLRGAYPTASLWVAVSNDLFPSRAPIVTPGIPGASDDVREVVRSSTDRIVEEGAHLRPVRGFDAP